MAILELEVAACGALRQTLYAAAPPAFDAGPQEDEEPAGKIA
jgi:hypothetical protein